MFFIRAMGCDYHHDRDFRIEREHGYDCYLALYLKSRSRLPEEGELVSCDENTFILFNQNSPHRYGADNEEYIEDWIQFECGSAFLTRLNLPFDKPVHIGGQVRLDRYFALIRDVFFRCINDSEITDHLMLAMLTEVAAVAAGDFRTMPHYKELMQLRRKIHAEPWLDWTVEKMAEELHISAAYMQELYKKTFGLSCISDVIECRISCARSLLTSSDMNIDEIASRCGYRSVVHFSRQFKKTVGISPSEWRKSRT